MTTLSNSVHLTGRLGMDPKFVEFDGGKMKVTFSPATSDYYKDAKGKCLQETQWHNIVAWGKVARIASGYPAKGRKTALEGRLTNCSYNDKDGNKKYITGVVANQILILDKNSGVVV